jgi:hypothetical protein
MAFNTVIRKPPGAARAPREISVRVGISNGVTQIHVPRIIAEKLSVLPTTSTLPIMVAVGNDEHQGLVQVTTRPEKANRVVTASNGKFRVTLARKITGLTAEHMAPVPVSWLINKGGKTLTVALPDSRFEVAQSAKAYLEQA